MPEDFIPGVPKDSLNFYEGGGRDGATRDVGRTSFKNSIFHTSVFSGFPGKCDLKIYWYTFSPGKFTGALIIFDSRTINFSWGSIGAYVVNSPRAEIDRVYVVRFK